MSGEQKLSVDEITNDMMRRSLETFSKNVHRDLEKLRQKLPSPHFDFTDWLRKGE